MRRFAAALLVATLALAAGAEDTVVLSNQSEIAGRIVSDDGERIVIDVVNPSGRMTIAYADIALINGLSAARLQSFRREAARAEAALGTRGIASPRGVARETRGVRSYEDLVMEHREASVDLALLARALVKFRLASPGWDAGTGLPQWKASFRLAAWDADAGILRLIVPPQDAPPAFEPFWTAAGRKPETYPIFRETARGALQQMLRLDQRRAALPGWDDRSLAFSASETGLAAALALDAVLDPTGLAADQGDAAVALATLCPEPGDAPEFLRAWRRFSEIEGARFFRAARLAGGWKLALRVLEDPPQSSEQLLHPEKYFVDRDVPTAVSLPSPSIPEGAGTLGFVRSGSLGEYLIYRSFLVAGGEGKGLDEVVARRAAAGWDGDAWVVLAPPEGEMALVWFTVWDTAEDAQEFAEAAADAAVLRAERGRRQVQGARILLDTAAGAGVVEVRGKEVVVVESVASPEVAAAFAEAAWRDAAREPGAGQASVHCDAAPLAAALACRDALAEAWPNGTPKATPISGTVETAADSGTRVFAAAGAFSVAIPDGWDHRAEPTSLTLAPKNAGGASVTFTFHALPRSFPAPLVFSRAWSLACPKGDGTMLPYAAKTADGRAWFQFVTANPERRVHLAWAISGSRLIRVEAVAPATGPGDDARRHLQAALASVRFLR